MTVIWTQPTFAILQLDSFPTLVPNFNLLAFADTISPLEKPFFLPSFLPKLCLIHKIQLLKPTPARVLNLQIFSFHLPPSEDSLESEFLKVEHFVIYISFSKYPYGFQTSIKAFLKYSYLKQHHNLKFPCVLASNMFCCKALKCALLKRYIYFYTFFH